MFPFSNGGTGGNKMSRDPDDITANELKKKDERFDEQTNELTDEQENG